MFILIFRGGGMCVMFGCMAATNNNGMKTLAHAARGREKPSE